MKRTLKLAAVGALGAVTITTALAATERADAGGGETSNEDGIVARAGDAVVRIGDNGVEARAGDARAGAGQAGDAQRNERGAGQRGDDRGREVTVEEGQVVLRMEGDKGVKFSGTCTVGGEEKKIEGQVPDEFTFELGDGDLECEVRKEGGNGTLKMVLTSGNDHVVQTVDGDATMKFTYSGNGVSSSTSSVSGSSNDVVSQSSSSSSVVQSNSSSTNR